MTWLSILILIISLPIHGLAVEKTGTITIFTCMFGLFESKKPKLTITNEDKHWVEDNLLWLGETFGFRRVINKPFLNLDFEDFPYSSITNEAQFNDLVVKLCAIWEVSPATIDIKVFDDVTSRQWSSKFIHKTEIYRRGWEENTFKAFVNESVFANAEKLLLLLSRQLAEQKLITHGIISTDTADNPITDLALIFFGFGVFLANNAFTETHRAFSRSAILPEPVIAYANALLCYISGENYKKVDDRLNSNTDLAFIRNYLYLQKTGNTLLDKPTIERASQLYNHYLDIETGFKEKNYSKVIYNCQQILSTESDMPSVWTNLGYAQLMLGRFSKAIKDFDNAIDGDPYDAYPFDNRAFCKLQTGDMQGAFTDISTSLEFDSQNAYAWRTLGIYYYLKNDLGRAIENLEKAYAMDNTTDLIHFYLAKAYAAAGNMEKEEYHFRKSMDAHEASEEFLKANRI